MVVDCERERTRSESRGTGELESELVGEWKQRRDAWKKKVLMVPWHMQRFSFAKVNNNENPWILKDATSKVLNILFSSSNTATVLKVANTAPMLLGVRICIGRRGIRDPRDSA